MTNFKDMFHLTKEEVRAIHRWLRQKRYESSRDTFKIIYEPWLDSINVSVSLNINGNTEWLEFDGFERDTEAEINTLQLGSHKLELAISAEHYSPFIPVLQKSVEAQVEEDIEHVTTFVFIVSEGLCEIYVAGTRIGTHPLKKIITDSSKVRLCFSNLTTIENLILCEDIEAKWIEENIPYFSAEDMKVLVKRLDILGYEVYGIECWSEKDMGYFKTYVQELYMNEYNSPEKDWFVNTYKQVLQEYAERVLSDEPDNPPIFNISIGR
ncbi:MAG: hypothetical protein C0602_05890 [Denitrovibrio sp.]|nr:MAG: hypothetical protein C0602_05890 [Denitrovibrio sp.]